MKITDEIAAKYEAFDDAAIVARIDGWTRDIHEIEENIKEYQGYIAFYESLLDWRRENGPSVAFGVEGGPILPATGEPGRIHLHGEPGRVRGL